MNSHVEMNKLSLVCDLSVNDKKSIEELLLYLYIISIYTILY